MSDEERSQSQEPQETAPEVTETTEATGNDNVESAASNTAEGESDAEFSDLSDLEDVDEDVELKYLEEQDAFKLGSHKKSKTSDSNNNNNNNNNNKSNTMDRQDKPLKRKEVVRPRKRKADVELEDNRTISYSNETDLQRKRRMLEERLDASIKQKTTRRKRKDEDDLEMFQDAAIQQLKESMKYAAEMDKESVVNGEPALEKLKLLPEVRNVLMRANLADSILDNNLLESVRIWLEPLPGASLPAYEIQKSLFELIVRLPIKTIHLQESGLGKIMLFYQRSKRIEPSIKRIADKLIGDWTRPIMKRSDNYRDKNIKTALFDYHKYKNSIPTSSQNLRRNNEQKTLYEEAAARRKRAAAPLARTTLYKVAPRVNPEIFNQRSSRDLLGIQPSSSMKDERFKSLSKKLNSMSAKKKAAHKGGISIEGKELGV